MYKFIKFEILYNIKRPLTYVFIIMMIGQGIWYSAGHNEYYGNSNTLLNASMGSYQNLAVMGMIAIILIAIISANAISRDIDAGTAENLYSIIRRDRQYFFGKYLGVLSINFLLIIAYPLGILLLPYTGFGTPEQFGPVPWGQMMHGFAIFTVPNLLLLTNLSVFLIVFTRKSGSAYIGSLFIMILVMITYSLREKTAYPVTIQMIDPFGYSVISNIADNMAIAELNKAYLPLTGIVTANRILWLSISLLLFVLAYLKYNFKYFLIRPVKKIIKRKKSKQNSEHVVTGKTSYDRVFGKRSMIVRVFRFAWNDFKKIANSVLFKATMGFFFFVFLMNHFFWTSEYYITTSHLPLTSVMTYARIVVMAMLFVIMLAYSVEVLFRERNTGVWQIIDSMPVPSWVLIISKFLTMASVAFSIATLLFVTGLIAQLLSGFTHIDWSLYIKDLYGTRFGWITLLQLVAMAFFIGSFTFGRLKGHVFSITVILFTMISLELKLIQQLRFTFPFVPGIEQYSEINGYGVFDTGLPWYGGAWTALAGIFLVLSVLFWNRGVERNFRERLHAAKKRFNPVYGSILAVFFLLFVFFQYSIHKNVIIKAGDLTIDQENAEAALYEKKFKKYAETVQPKITGIDLKIDIFPDMRKAAYTAILAMKNKSDRSIGTLHIDRKRILKLDNLATDRELQIIDNDEKLRHCIYKISRPLEPGETMQLIVKGDLQYKGFHQLYPEADLTYRYTFLGTDLLPYFGYDEDRELDNNKDRIEQGLEKIDSRLNDQNNTFSRSNSLYSDQGDRVTWNMVISTSQNQEILGPGKRIRSWQNNSRNFAHYVSERPGNMDFKIITGEYHRKDFVCATTDVALLYHREHTFNIECISEAVKRSYAWLTKKIGKYPYSSIGLVEKIHFDDDFVTFGNVTAISENHGWTADISKTEDEEYIYYTVARELARQWTGALVTPANVQGAQIFTESIPEYYALSFMDDIFGHKRNMKWLDENYHDYQEGKGEEEIEEKLLLDVDNAVYVSREKGGLALYALSQRQGKEKFNRWLRHWLLTRPAVDKGKNGFVISNDFYRDLKGELSPELYTFADEYFKQRIQYQLVLKEAYMENNLIILQIEAARGVMDSLGNMTKSPFSLPLEIGVLNSRGALVKTEQLHLVSGIQKYNLPLTLSGRSCSIVLDPNYWYIVASRGACSLRLEGKGI